jgi:N-acetylglutamate synthase-like GNAT family acetyltransferase
VTGKQTLSVRIEQPSVNKITAFALGGLAAFLTLLLLTKIQAAGFTLFILVFLVAVFVYVYRAINVEAIATPDGISVQNLVRSADFQWSEVDVLAVIPTKSGPGTGITVELKNGSVMPIEASWGPWYQGKMSAETTKRCERLIEDIRSMRRYDPQVDAVEAQLPVDPVLVRVATEQDADGIARIFDAAWTETYSEILPGSLLLDRKSADDAQMLRELLDGSIPRASAVLVERDGDVVGASVFAPTTSKGVEDFMEIFMLYIRADELGTGTGRRLVLRSFNEIRASGALGIVGNVYVNNRKLRSQIEHMGVATKGETHEQVWYGVPVKVVEYSLTF